MTRDKPHHGRLDAWHIAGGAVWAIFRDHPTIRVGSTSPIVRRNGDEVETMKSRYTLGDPGPAGETFHEALKRLLAERERIRKLEQA